MLITSIFDNVAGRFLGFQLVDSESVAVRGFYNALKFARPDDLLYTNPKDFDLFVLGTFDEQLGIFDDTQEHKCIARGSSVIAQIREEGVEDV